MGGVCHCAWCLLGKACCSLVLCVCVWLCAIVAVGGLICRLLVVGLAWFSSTFLLAGWLLHRIRCTNKVGFTASLWASGRCGRIPALEVEVSYCRGIPGFTSRITGISLREHYGATPLKGLMGLCLAGVIGSVHFSFLLTGSATASGLLQE